MSRDLHYTFIIPVYNRPEEIDELLRSMASQTDLNFDVLVVEDGSAEKCDHIIRKYRGHLDIEYYYKENTGPGKSRNYGFERARGNYCIFLDSDCILPPQYFASVKQNMAKGYVDAYGGPDRAHADFTPLQKAINYSMTSFFTTGGIRGGSEKVQKFNPRSFNMGFSREVFERTGGFPEIRFAKSKAAGEDLDLSYQIKKHGFKTALFSDAYVYHKRRTNLRQFFRQVYSFGYSRISIFKRHREALKWLHFVPAAFILASLALLVLGFVKSPCFLIPLALHMLLIAADASIKYRSLTLGLLAVLTSYIQLYAYGIGFTRSIFDSVFFPRKTFD